MQDIVTFILMPMEFVWAATVMWLAGDFMCRLMSFFRVFGLFLSSNVLICISLNRFFAIIRPLSSCSSSKNLKIQLIIAWIVSILDSSPQPFVFHVAAHPNHTWYTQCVTFGAFPSEEMEKAYVLFGMLKMYFIPLVVVAVTYSLMLIKICRKARNEARFSFVRNGSSLARSNSQSGILRRSGASIFDRARVKTLKMTVVIVAVFILCWTPYYVMVFWFLIDKESFKLIDQKIQHTFFLFACLNSVMNPIVYGFFNVKETTSRLDNQASADQHIVHAGQQSMQLRPMTSFVMSKNHQANHQVVGGNNTDTRNGLKFPLSPASSNVPAEVHMV